MSQRIFGQMLLFILAVVAIAEITIQGAHQVARPFAPVAPMDSTFRVENLVATGNVAVTGALTKSGNNVLTTTSTISSALITFHGARAIPSGSVSSSSGTATTATWGAEDYDTDAYHDNSSNTGRITIPAGLGGYYFIDCDVFWGSSATTVRQILIKKNAGNTPTGGTLLASGHTSPRDTGSFSHSVATVAKLVAGDEVQCIGLQNTGTINLVSNIAGEHFGAALLGIP